ncbi:hypothetical protein EIK77_009211 [Talaromyces pinophilus]|nr:hypothetical protein EIK77_009211 [Talaromyces pinophilus]
MPDTVPACEVRRKATARRLGGFIEWASVLHKAAWCDWRKGNGGEGAKLSVRAMKTWKKYLGPEHEKTLSSMGLVGLIDLLRGRLKEAEELFVQVMETRKRVLGAEHPDTLTSMANLAFTWKEQGRSVEALDLFQECVQLQSKVLGVKHIDTVSSSATLIGWQAEKLDIKQPANGAI